MDLLKGSGQLFFSIFKVTMKNPNVIDFNQMLWCRLRRKLANSIPVSLICMKHVLK